MALNQTSKKVNEKSEFSNLQDKREKLVLKHKLDDSVRTADTLKVFSKGDATNYGYKIYTLRQILHDTIPSYGINHSPERRNENLLISTRITLDENNQIIKEPKFLN